MQLAPTGYGSTLAMFSAFLHWYICINATKAKLGIIPANKQTKQCNKQVKEVHNKNPKTNKQTTKDVGMLSDTHVRCSCKYIYAYICRINLFEILYFPNFLQDQVVRWFVSFYLITMPHRSYLIMFGMDWFVLGECDVFRSRERRGEAGLLMASDVRFEANLPTLALNL